MGNLDLTNSPLLPFSEQWIPDLCKWIKCLDDLIYWSGNTFHEQGFSPSSLRDHLDNQYILPLVQLDNEGRLIAYGEIVKKNKLHRLNLCRIIVHPDQRGLGIGYQFCKSLIHICLSLGSYESVRLNVLEKNKRALSCYLSLGFIKIGVLPKARKVGRIEQDVIIMSKSLKK